jgi:hypothetical protein
VLAPPGATVFTLRVPVDEVVLVVRSGHVPHLPFAMVINQVWFVNASVFPFFMRNEHRFGLSYPLTSIPLQKPNGVWSPEVLRRARVVDAFYPRRFASVPSPYLRWAVPPTLAIPSAAKAWPGNWF